MKDVLKQTSKFLSLVLRHEPHSIGIELDPAGWVDVDVLLAACGRAGVAIDRPLLEQVVAENEKKRFAFNDDGTRIRASQGHSVEVALGYEAAVPPERLYHGTAAKNVGSILASGLNPGSRHAVHLSESPETAVAVGARHGRPVVLGIRAGDMHRAGLRFEKSANGVWLADGIPPQFIEPPKE